MDLLRLLVPGNGLIRKVNTELLLEKRSEEKWERNLYCVSYMLLLLSVQAESSQKLVRDTFEAKIEIENDDEIVNHIPACDEELETFLGDDTKGPNPDELHIDRQHRISSKWNQAVVQIMVDTVRDQKKKDSEDKKFNRFQNVRTTIPRNWSYSVWSVCDGSGERRSLRLKRMAKSKNVWPLNVIWWRRPHALAPDDEL